MVLLWQVLISAGFIFLYFGTCPFCALKLGTDRSFAVRRGRWRIYLVDCGLPSVDVQNIFRNR